MKRKRRWSKEIPTWIKGLYEESKDRWFGRAGQFQLDVLKMAFNKEEVCKMLIYSEEIIDNFRSGYKSYEEQVKRLQEENEVSKSVIKGNLERINELEARLSESRRTIEVLKK